MNKLLHLLEEWLVKMGLNDQLTSELDEAIKLLTVIIFATLLWLILRLVLRLIKKRLLKYISTRQKDKEQLNAILRRVVNIIIISFVYQLIPQIFDTTDHLSRLLSKICIIAIIIYSTSIINRGLKVCYHIISKKEKYKQRPLKGVMQILQLSIYFIGAIILIAAIIDKSPVGLFTGLGAFAAVLSFIFKDTILGFVAGIQLSYNDMVRPGDWITINNSLANGIIIDINLISIKIQNFDNTIINVPTYSLINTTFQNWRGMEESGGRRITISYNIDTDSVEYCTEQAIEKYGEYVQIPSGYNPKDGKNKESFPQITNLELYRMYLTKMILNNPQINKELTLMVRYLQPGPQGIPIQIYCFSKNKSWVIYEGIQASILENAIASAGIFNLRIFQTIINSSRYQ